MVTAITIVPVSDRSRETSQFGAPDPSGMAANRISSVG